MNTIMSTIELAIERSKTNCIRQFESYFDIVVNDAAFITNELIWLQKNTSINCECGETSAIEMIMFTKYITAEMCENGTPQEEMQFNSVVGVCEACGEN